LAIVSVMGAAPWGGSEELWAAGALAARRSGWEVLVSVEKWPEMPPRIRQLQADRVHVIRRSKRLRSFRRLYQAVSRVRTPLAEVAGFRPDVLCLSQGGTYDIAYDPVLWGVFDRLVLAQKSPLVVICQYNEDSPPPEIVRQRTSRLFARAQVVVFVSNRNLHQAERHLARHLDNAVLLSNPVNLCDMSSVPWPDGEQSARMACVARLDVRYKGQDLLFEALSSPTWEQRDWILSLYGAGHDEGYLRRLAGHFGIESRVVFHGHVVDIRSIWDVHHLLVLASRGEGTPLALIEAMLCGRPAVVTDVGGNADWIDDGVTGFIASASTVPAFSAALERAWGLRCRWPTMGKVAHEVAISRFRDAGQALFEVLQRAMVPVPGHLATSSPTTLVSQR